MARGISDKDMIFIDEYLIDMDAKNAAIRAGYKPTTAAKASEWIRRDNPTKPRVREELDRRLAERSRRCGVTADRVIAALAKVAFADISDIIDLDSGEFLPDADKCDTSAIASVKVKRTLNGTEREIRMADRNKALELLGKHLGMFAENAKGNAADLSKIDKLIAEVTDAAKS